MRIAISFQLILDLKTYFHESIAHFLVRIYSLEVSKKKKAKMNHNSPGWATTVLSQRELHFDWTINKQRKQNSFHCFGPKCQKLFPIWITRLSFTLDFFLFVQFERPTPIDSTSDNEMAFHLCTHRIMNFIESVRRNYFRIPLTPIYTPMPCHVMPMYSCVRSEHLVILTWHFYWSNTAVCTVCARECVNVTRAAKRPIENLARIA